MMNGGRTTGFVYSMVVRLVNGIVCVKRVLQQLAKTAFSGLHLSFSIICPLFRILFHSFSQILRSQLCAAILPRRIAFAARLCVFASALPLLFSCGTRSGQFKMEGRFRNFNNGEFYVYSPELPANGLDTIKVSDGRFSYIVPLDDKATFVILFPNFSEQAVFGESGAKVSISGDASHLKEIEIKGTKDNELMTKFRQNANRLSPPEETKAAEEFIVEHSTTPVSLYLLQKYFIRSERPDIVKAASLLSTMIKASPDNMWLKTLNDRLKTLKGAAVGNRLPSFSVRDINGKQTGNISLKSKVNIINVWASWSYDSQNVQRGIVKLKKKHADDIAVLGICLDGNVADCRKVVERDSVTWPVVCDKKMWQSPFVARLGIGKMPSTIIVDRNGKVVARDLRNQNLDNKVEELLK